MAAKHEASPTTVTTDCQNEGCEYEITGKEVDTRRVSGSDTSTQSEAGARVPLEALPTGSHMALVDTTERVHNRHTTELPETPAEDEEVSELEEALGAFWSLLLQAGYEPC